MINWARKKHVVNDDLQRFMNNEAILQIWRNTTTTREDFNKAYIPALYTVFSSVDTDAEKGYLSHLTFALLVARNGIVLGKKLPFEDAIRIKNSFTYALAMAPLLQTLAVAQCRQNGFAYSSVYAAAMCQDLLGDTGYKWLRRNDAVYFDFLNYFIDPSASEIHGAIKHVLANNPLIDEKRQRFGFAPIVFTGVPGPAGSTIPDSPAHVPEDGTKKRSAASAYLYWLEQAISDGHVSTNANDSAVHKLDDGDYFLIMNECFNAYCAETGIEAKQLKKNLRNKKCLRVSKNIDFYFAEINNIEVKGVILKGLYLKDMELGTSEHIQLKETRP